MATTQQKIDADGGRYVEVQVLSEDVSTFLILAPEEEYLGAKVQGFIPREDGGLSALEMHGQVRMVILNTLVVDYTGVEYNHGIYVLHV